MLSASKNLGSKSFGVLLNLSWCLVHKQPKHNRNTMTPLFYQVPQHSGSQSPIPEVKAQRETKNCWEIRQETAGEDQAAEQEWIKEKREERQTLDTSQWWGVRIHCIWGNTPTTLTKWILSPLQALLPQIHHRSNSAYSIMLSGPGRGGSPGLRWPRLLIWSRWLAARQLLSNTVMIKEKFYTKKKISILQTMNRNECLLKMLKLELLKVKTAKHDPKQAKPLAEAAEVAKEKLKPSKFLILIAKSSRTL